MPDISELNGTAIANVAEFDALTVTEAAGVTPPLDTYTGAAAAYSVRLLRTAYTGDIMRVRRGSDNVEADVGFDGNNLLSLTSPISNTSDAQSYTDFADFVDHTGTPTDARVRTWYDQSGNSNDTGNATQIRQPQVYDSVTGLETENGNPCIRATGVGNTDAAFDFSLAASTVGFTCFSIIRSYVNINVFMRGPGFGAYIGASQDGSTSVIDQQAGNVSYRLDEATFTPADRDEFYDDTATGNHLLSFYTDITTSFPQFLGYSGTLAMYQMQEAIFYRSNEFTGGNLSGIETNLKTYFNTP